MSEAFSTQGPGDTGTRTRRQTQAWMLFLLLHRMLFHRVGHHGAKGIRLLQDRNRMFDSGRWLDLLEGGRRTVPTERAQRTTQSADEEREARQRAATALVEQGELSHAARVLKSPGLAPGTEATLLQLRSPSLRPQALMSPLPVQALSHAPSDAVKIDRQILAAALQSARRGLSPGLGGTRYEFWTPCLEDDAAIQLLAEACEHVDQSDMPQDIVGHVLVSRDGP
jgi:hypothetical protein